jgi:hypothetical protein
MAGLSKRQMLNARPMMGPLIDLRASEKALA